MVGRTMLALWPWGSLKEIEIMGAVFTRDLHALSFNEGVGIIKDYISNHTFSERVAVYDDPGSFIAFEVDQGPFLACIYQDPEEGTKGFIRDETR